MAPRGLAASITQSHVSQNLIQKILETYINMFPVTVKYHFDRAYDICMENPLGIPTLCLYSSNDVILDLERIESNIAEQRKMNPGVPLLSYDFDAPHVQIFRHYPEKYSELLDDFFKFVQLKSNL